MLLIRCPYCSAERPELEFTYAGEAHIARPADPSKLSDEEWRDHLFIRTNPRGIHFERWRHQQGCNRFFNAVRNTLSDKFLMTYEAGLSRPSEAELDAAASALERKETLA